ncbi:alpha/beta hydrolase [Arthrobacter sp. NPDC080031]|uniref:alpha/beta fold hydrolase n=1 Tax=Arthrobacter sp. NPDC080031 TaxID=3155918 RepID=UPI00344BB4BC
MENTDIRRARSGLVYGQRGTGPAVLLVHGWCLDRTAWLYLEQDLVDAGYEVITPALAGYGASSDVAGPYTLSRHAGDMKDLLDELDLNGVTVVGFALGAAVLLSLEDYARVGGIVSIGVPTAAGAPYDRMRRAIKRDWPLFAQRSVTTICHRKQSDATLAWLGHMYGSTRLDAAIAGTELLAEFEPTTVSQRWTVPSTFIHGANDTIVSTEVSAECVRLFEGAELVILDDCGHYVPLDQKDALLAEVIRRAEGTAHEAA